MPPAAPAPPPSIDTSRFPPRLSVLDEARRAATEAELERISPAWDFKVSALGFIVHGSLRHGAASSEALRTEVTALASQHHRSLGFTEPPLVSENGEGFKGPRFVMQGPASFLVVNSGGGEFTGHAWPLKCAEPNAPGLVTPLLGRPIVIETRGQPCDPAGAMRCTSVPPTRRAARLGSRDVILRPAVVLTASPTPGEVEVHCAVRVELAAGVRATGPFPRLLDVVTGAQLDEVDEAALRR